MRARKSARSVNRWSFEVGETYAVAHDELPPLGSTYATASA